MPVRRRPCSTRSPMIPIELGGRAWIIVVGDIPAVPRLAELEGQPIGRRAANHELLEVDRAMVQIAERDQVAQLMAAAMALVLDMM